jgi:hypothetical protein
MNVRRKPTVLFTLGQYNMMHRNLLNDASCGILSKTSMGWCVWCRVPGSFFITELHFARNEPESALLSVLEGIGTVEKYFTHTHTHTHMMITF